MNERVDVLSLYDVVGTPGVGADVGHIDSIAKVGINCNTPLCPRSHGCLR